MEARRIAARAIAIRWRCPLDSVTPRSPSMVSYPWGIAAMNSWALARRAAASISAAVTLGAPKAMLSRTLAANRKVSWSTTLTCARSDCRVYSRMSRPSISTRPCGGS